MVHIQKMIGRYFMPSMILIVVLVGSIPTILAAGVTQNVQYSVADSASIPVNVTLMYANGTYDAATSGSPTWLAGRGLSFNGSAQGVNLNPSATVTCTSLSINILVNITANATSKAYIYSFRQVGGTWCALVQKGYNVFMEEYNGGNSTLQVTANTAVTKNRIYLINFGFNSSTEWYTVNGITKTALNILPSLNNSHLDMANNYGSSYWTGNIYSVNITMNTLPKICYFINEGSGTKVYGYDCYANFTSQNSARALTISRQSGVNSSLMWGINNFGSTFPYTRGYWTWNLAAGNATSWRVNDSGNQTLYLNHYETTFYLTVNAPTGGSLNVTSWAYALGASVPILATANSQYSFQHINIDGTNSSSNPYTLTMNANHTVTAYFALIQYYLTINTAINGNVNQSSAWFTNGTNVGIQATPNLNYAFQYLNVDGVNYTSNPYTVVMTANHTVTAYFTLIQYYLTVTLDGHESTNQSSAWFTNGTTVGMLATPNLNYYFTNFTIDGSLVTSNPTSVLMTANHTVSIYSSLLRYYLTVADNGHGAENVTSGWFTNGTSVTLLNAPNLNCYFGNYQLDEANGTSNPLTVTMTSNHTVSYYDYLLQFYLTVAATGNGNLNVTSGWYINGTQVSILTTPSLNYAFQYINVDGVNYTQNPLMVNMTANHTVTAYFTQEYYLTVNAPTGGSLNVTSGWYASGTAVPILATANNQFVFQYSNIDGSNSTTSPFTVTMSANHTVTAYFIQQYYLTVNAPTGGALNVTSGWYNDSTSVPILATVNSQYVFQYSNIDGANSTDNPLTVTMTANHTVTAYFLQQFYLTVSNNGYSIQNVSSGWYNISTVVVVQDTPDINYACNYSLDGSVSSTNPVSITMYANHTITYSDYIYQYYLTITTPSNGNLNVTSGWYSTGSNVPVLATPSLNYAFQYINVDGSNSSSNPYTITMSANHTFTACFTLIQWYLTVDTDSQGTVNTTSGWYTNGTTVVVLDIPYLNYQFANFTVNATASISNPISILMTGNATIICNNSLIQYYLTVNAPTGGTLDQSSAWFTNGTDVGVLATASGGYAFQYINVDGANSTSNPYDVLMTANHTVTAYFTQEYYLTVNAPTGGSLNVTSGWYASGTAVPILATANNQFVFQYMNVDGANSTTNPYTITMSANHTVTPYFLQQFYLTVSNNGYSIQNVSSGWYNISTVVVVQDTPASNYICNYSLDGMTGASNPISITMDANHTLTYNDYLQLWYLTVYSPTWGTLNVTSGWYTNGTLVPVLATPSLNYAFQYINVDGSNSSSNPYMVAMTGNHTITVYFTLIQYYLTVNSPTGGTLNQTSSWLINGTYVGIVATPSLNYAFQCINVDGVNYTLNPYNLTMNANHTVIACFTLVTWNLTVNTPLGGTINQTSATFANGTVVGLSATPSLNYAFQCINVDGVNYTSNPLTITMTQNHTVSAYFQPMVTNSFWTGFDELCNTFNSSLWAYTWNPPVASGNGCWNFTVPAGTKENIQANFFNITGYGTYTVSMSLSPKESGANYWIFLYDPFPSGSVNMEIDLAEFVGSVPLPPASSGDLDVGNWYNGTSYAHSGSSIFYFNSENVKGSGINLYDGNFHNYTYVYTPSDLAWYVDGVEVFDWQVSCINKTNCPLALAPMQFMIGMKCNGIQNVTATMLVDYISYQPDPNCYLNLTTSEAGTANVTSWQYSNAGNIATLLGTGSGWYPQGSNITAYACPGSGASFVNWYMNGTYSASNPYAFMMSGNTTLQAVFTNTSYALTVNTPVNGNINQTTQTFVAGTVLGLLATPAVNYTFGWWTINGANYTANPYQLTMNQNYTVSATFVLAQ